MSDEELQSIVKTYGNEQNDVKYIDFLTDATPYQNKYSPQETSLSGTKSSYQPNATNYSGETTLDNLLFKIRAQIKKDRIRLLEFF